MKDRIFSGPDVEEALATAAASLGLPMAELRYVVLEAGTPAGRGLKPTPARIAVLIQEEARGIQEGPRGGRSREGRESGEPPPRTAEPADVKGFVREVVEAAELELDVEIEPSEDAVVVQLHGKDSGFFHGEDGRGEPLLALEHLLQRIFGHALYPRVLRVRCEGFRERRDQALAEEARRLAEAVRSDKEPRTMEPLNAYERRVVHLALQAEPGVRTYSVGEGRERRVTIAPEDAADGGGADGR